MVGSHALLDAVRSLPAHLPRPRVVEQQAGEIVYVPDVHELLYPVLTVLPLQLLGYHIAVALDRDVDQPRNLAKTVTVE